MKIICTEPNDYKMALALADVACAAGIKADVTCRQDAYTLTIWSIDDVTNITDKRVNSLSEADKERFMEYAQKQLKSDMVERGWNSLRTLIDLFFEEGA